MIETRTSEIQVQALKGSVSHALWNVDPYCIDSEEPQLYRFGYIYHTEQLAWVFASRLSGKCGAGVTEAELQKVIQEQLMIEACIAAEVLRRFLEHFQGWGFCYSDRFS